MNLKNGRLFEDNIHEFENVCNLENIHGFEKRFTNS
jgi:flagellar biosynthesis/type III secretory pathway chaperone